MDGAQACPNCGWMPVTDWKVKENKLKTGLIFWIAMLGMCGGCGYLAYAGLGAGLGFGPLNNIWGRIAMISIVVIWVIGTSVQSRRRRK